MKRSNISTFISEYACLIFLLVVLIIASFLSDDFFTLNNLQNLLKQGSVLCVLSVGLGFILVSGCIDLTVGVNMAIASCIVINLFDKIGTILSILLAICVSILISCINMFIIHISKARAMEIMMITFGLKQIYRGVAQALTRNVVYRYVKKGLFSYLGKGMIMNSIPMIAVIMLIIVIILGIVMSKTVFGRKVIYIGHNPEASRLAGIKVNRIRLLCFVVSGICCAIAGTLLASRTGAVKALSGDNWEMNAVCALVIGGYSMSGGFGSSWRCIVGTYVFTIIGNILNLLGANAYLQIVVQGSVMLLAVWIDVFLRVGKEAK